MMCPSTEISLSAPERSNVCFSVFHKMSKILVGTTASRSAHFASQFSKTNRQKVGEIRRAYKFTKNQKYKTYPMRSMNSFVIRCFLSPETSAMLFCSAKQKLAQLRILMVLVMCITLLVLLKKMCPF